MFVQMLTIQAAPESIPQLRELVKQRYLPRIKTYPGFVSAHLVAHMDHRDAAKLIITWASESAMKAAQKLQKDDTLNLPDVPGLNVYIEGYQMQPAQGPASTGD